ncbi:23S rRNA (adenine(2030)-N(6))-methyltransferase RlmJ [Aestuariicoccus sp. MJ-SS9]|uniref:23S rRNA (adenine(2030)-N(6))-methyltransferase RlmJ n=1 Tax=Aestuariicoccus sp. MJ-SS9 TaxID=3079855 RepID=UPI00290F3EF8|nr:23S rRNA (adenine(2030)-N(6))-methyltransferase RlmJ [Aestuariicoccus sp. MJ-SS9]MDU8910227.1 23S rRNA (adenine(2030)-N(6))-methyltransferase RlmJ [Aestuariicoccus sp. MJ-SS9]
MLSYQHAYHAGNLADVHKHALLAWMLDYLTQKPKPLTYIETHAGRGLYDLGGAEAVKTGEAAAGIARLRGAFAPDHPYARALSAIAIAHGAQAYPGSPLIAATLLRDIDSLHLAELHPAEHAALSAVPWPRKVQIHRQDGFEMAQALCPPTPRRGLMLIDPSYEVKDDYARLPKTLQQIHRKWNVGILCLWYPILTSGAHQDMLARLTAAFPGALRHEVGFPPVREGHRMTGSGLFVVNPPYGLDHESETLGKVFKTLD